MASGTDRPNAQPTAKVADDRRGASLIEMLIAMGMLGVLLATLVPRSALLVRGYSLNIAADQLASELQKARVDAARRNQPITLRFTGQGGYQISGQPERVLFGGATVPDSAPDSVRFDPMGRATTGSAVIPVNLSGRGKSVRVTASGFASVL